MLYMNAQGLIFKTWNISNLLNCLEYNIAHYLQKKNQIKLKSDKWYKKKADHQNQLSLSKITSWEVSSANLLNGFTFWINRNKKVK